MHVSRVGLVGLFVVCLALPASASASPSTTFAADHERREGIQQRREGLSASVAAVPLTIAASAQYGAGYCGERLCDRYNAVIVNQTGGNIADPYVEVRYEDAAHAAVSTDILWADCWVLPPEAWATLATIQDWPSAAATHWHIVGAYGFPTSDPRVSLGATISYVGGWPHEYQVTVTNTNPFTVVGSLTSVVETFTLSGGSPEFDCVPEVYQPYQMRLAPGESVAFRVVNMRGTKFTGTYSAEVVADAIPAPATSPVYRFYNRRTGTHFYTIDANERDYIIANLGGMLGYDGEAYRAYPTEQVNSTPLFRFYNKRTGTHFYTADPDEANEVIATMSGTFQFEGPGYYIADSGGLATNTAWRFYNTRAGVHFYTIDPNERDYVVANLGSIYSLEGAAFNVPK